MNNFLSNLYHRVAWRAGLDILSRGLFIIVNLLIARTLTVSDFGKLGYALSFAQIFYTFVDLGTGAQLLKEMGEFHERRDLWVYYLKLRFAMIAACIVIFAALPWFVWRWEHPWLMYFVLLVVFANSLLDFSQFVCNGLDRMDLSRLTLFVQRGCAIFGIAIGLTAFRSLVGVITTMMVGSVIGASSSLWLLLRKSGSSWVTPSPVAEWKRIVTVSLPNAVSGAFGMWYLRIAPLILGWVVSSHELGEYNGAFRVFEATYILPASIMAIGLPHLALALKNDLRSYDREFRRIGMLMVPGAIAWACFLRIGSSWIIRTLLGVRFEGAIPILSVLGCVGGMVFLNYFVTYPMVVINAQRRHALHQMLVFLFSVTASIVLIQRRGAIGAAWSLFATELFLFTLTSIYLLRWHRRMAVQCA